MIENTYIIWSHDHHMIIYPWQLTMLLCIEDVHYARSLLFGLQLGHYPLLMLEIEQNNHIYCCVIKHYIKWWNLIMGVV